MSFVCKNKVLYELVNNWVLEGSSSEDMEFGAGNCMFEFSTMMNII